MTLHPKGKHKHRRRSTRALLHNKCVKGGKGKKGKGTVFAPIGIIIASPSSLSILLITNEIDEPQFGPKQLKVNAPMFTGIASVREGDDLFVGICACVCVVCVVCEWEGQKEWKRQKERESDESERCRDRYEGGCHRWTEREKADKTRIK